MVLISTCVCLTHVILTIKILLLTPHRHPHFAGKLPRSPLCLHLTYLQKQTGRTCPSWSIKPLQLSLIAPAIKIQSSSPEQPGIWRGCPLGQPWIAPGMVRMIPGGDPPIPAGASLPWFRAPGTAPVPRRGVAPRPARLCHASPTHRPCLNCRGMFASRMREAGMWEQPAAGGWRCHQIAGRVPSPRGWP